MDVVEQGRRDRWEPPRWLRGNALVVALALTVLVVTRPHLLSAGGAAAHRPAAVPTADRTPSTPPLRLGENTSQGISLVVRQGDHLERYEAGSGRWPLAMLPKGLPDPAPLVHASLLDGSGPLVGVALGVLFRSSPLRGRSVTTIGRADRVLAPSPEPGRLFILLRGGPRNGSRLVELAAQTGKITDQRPFPGYDPAGQWRPIAVFSSPGSSRLLLTRATGGGRVQLALAVRRVRAAADGDRGRFALARLVPGGRSGLLVGGTDGLVESITPVGGPDGLVLFAVPRPEGTRVRVWFPGARSAALLLDLPALKPGAELVCACR